MDNLLEFFWTFTPTLILWTIGLNSLRLLYLMDEILDSELTVKVLGSQWFWLLRTCSNSVWLYLLFDPVQQHFQFVGAAGLLGGVLMPIVSVSLLVQLVAAFSGKGF